VGRPHPLLNAYSLARTGQLLAHFFMDCDHAVMTSKALLDEILKLPPAERLQLIEDAWESLAASAEAIPVPEWHRAELDHLLDQASPEPPIPWDEARARLRDIK
jgi:putative addiction module component (TIGR02574 family)